MWKLIAQWTSRADVAKGRQTLEEALNALEQRAGRKQLRTLKRGRSSGEDDPISQEFGDRHRVEHHGTAGNGEFEVGTGNQYVCYSDANKTLKSS